jgi:hypothetical protein
VKSKASSLAFSLLIKTSIVVDDDFTCPLLNLLTVLPKRYWNQQPNRIGWLWIRLKAIRGFKQENKTII